MTTVAPETIAPQIDPLFSKLLDAGIALNSYQKSLKQYEKDAQEAKGSGLPFSGKAPELTAQVALGQHLEEVSQTVWQQFDRAQDRLVDSEDHSALDTAIQSIGQVADPLDRLESASTAAAVFTTRLDYSFADINSITAQCPEVIRTGSTSDFVDEIGDRLTANRNLSDKYESETTFLESVLNNSEYIDQETLTLARLYRGEIVGRKIDSVLKKNHDPMSTISAVNLLSYLGLPADSGITETQIGNVNPFNLDVPEIVARISRTVASNAAREHLQGITLGLVKGSLNRRDDHNEQEYKNLTISAFNALANLHDPENFNFWSWVNGNLNDRSVLQKFSAEIDKQQGLNHLWTDLKRKQSNIVDDHQRTEQKIV